MFRRVLFVVHGLTDKMEFIFDVVALDATMKQYMTHPGMVERALADVFFERLVADCITAQTVRACKSLLAIGRRYAISNQLYNIMALFLFGKLSRPASSAETMRAFLGVLRQLAEKQETFTALLARVEHLCAQ